LSAGLLQPSSGNIYLDELPLDIKSRKVGYMFQRDYLFEWRTIWKNITLGIEIQKPNEKEKKFEFAEVVIKCFLV
jgi:NitT/TauT family transport system ATP-binding protein